MTTTIARALLITVLCLDLGLPFAIAAARRAPDQKTDTKSPVKNQAPARESTKISNASSQLAMTFHPNVGQADPNVHFMAHGRGYGVFITNDEAAVVLAPSASAQEKKLTVLRNSDEQKRSLELLRWRFIRANPQPKFLGVDELALKTNYLRGNNRKQWQTNVASYEKVRIADLYKGIDLLYAGQRARLQYEFLVSPGANPESIEALVSGPQAINLADNGDLLFRLRAGELRQTKPIAYQEIGGAKTEVAVRYVLKDRTVTFAVGDYDHSRPLVIDPTLDFAILLGTPATDIAADVAVDGAGAAYVTGRTDWPGFSPITGSVAMGSSILVLKVDRTGVPVYLTLVGQGGGKSIKVNAAGKVYLTGTTWGGGIAVTPGVSGSVYRGGFDAFVCVLNESGSDVVYSTYLGGSRDDTGAGIDIGPMGSAYVTGTTESADFPGILGRGLHGPSDLFVMKVDSNGRFEFPSIFGGSAADSGVGIARDDDGSIYVTGQTTNDFPTTPGAFRESFRYPTPIPGFVFVLKLFQAPITTHVPASLRVRYSTLIGQGEVRAIAVHNGTAYITGATGDGTYPTTPSAFSRDPHIGTICFGESCLEAFVTRLNEGGTALMYSTFLGGINDDQGSDIAVDAAGLAFVTGQTGSTAPGLGRATPTFPTTSDAVQPVPTIFGYDAFLTAFTEDGGGLRYSTFIQTSEADIGTGVAVFNRRPTGQSVYMTGYTTRLPPDLMLFRAPVGYSVRTDDLFIVRFDF